MLHEKSKYMYFGFFVTVTVSFLVFYCAILFQVWQPENQHWVSDLAFHAKIIEKSSASGNFPAYSLLYRMINILSDFSLDYDRIAYTLIIFLALLTGIKYLVNYSILSGNSANTALVALLSLGLVFVMPIMSYFTQEQYPAQTVVNSFHVYLGNISPNQWHNSTLILSMPVNIILFYYAVKNMYSEKTAPFLVMAALVVFSILCKPNYSLAFLPAICGVIFIANIKSRHYLSAFIKPAILGIPAVLTLYYQWYFTYISNDIFDHNSGTVIAPFLVWSTYSPHIYFSLLLSIAFPLLIAVFYFKKLDRFTIMSWLVFLISLVIFSLFAESPSHVSGNYWWGCIASNFILFLFSIKLLLSQPLDWKAKTAYAVFVLHLLSGIFLLASFFIKQTSLII